MSGLVMVAAAVVALNGNWNLKGWPTPGRGAVRTLEEVPAAEVSVPAKVPGCYELDLCAAGLLPDLFYANNHYSVRKYEGHQWLYSRAFTLGKIPDDEKAVREGENEISVLFRAPVVESQFKNIAPIGNANSSADLVRHRQRRPLVAAGFRRAGALRRGQQKGQALLIEKKVGSEK